MTAALDAWLHAPMAAQLALAWTTYLIGTASPGPSNMAIMGMAYYLRQRQGAQKTSPVLSDEDRRKVQEILKSGDAS